MAKMILTASFITLGAVDRRDWVARSELAVDVETKDATVWASGGWKENLTGLKSGNMALMFKNDHAAGALDETMWALFLAGAPVPFELRASNAARSVNNPGYTGNLLITGWTPISGSPGDLNEFTVTYPTTGPVSRLVA